MRIVQLLSESSARVHAPPNSYSSMAQPWYINQRPYTASIAILLSARVRQMGRAKVGVMLHRRRHQRCCYVAYHQGRRGVVVDHDWNVYKHRKNCTCWIRGRKDRKRNIRVWKIEVISGGHFNLMTTLRFRSTFVSKLCVAQQNDSVYSPVSNSVDASFLPLQAAKRRVNMHTIKYRIV